MYDNNEFCKPCPKPNCPLSEVNGFMSNGKQFDLDITLPQDNRNVIYGTVKNNCKDPIKDAVVKLVEIIIGKDGMKKRIPVTHTFTDEYGEFVFGPLCPDKTYAIDIWVNDVHNYKLCAICHREGDCLKGKPIEICGCIKHEDEYQKKYCEYDKCEEKYEPKKCECDKHEDKCEQKKCECVKHEDKCEQKKRECDKHEDKCEPKMCQPKQKWCR